MNQIEHNYSRIEKAIAFIKDRYKEQPTLDEIASRIALSPFHFQKLFSEWAGVSPKKFIQFLSLEYCKNALLQNNNLENTSFKVGLSGTGRLHDLFVNIEAMTPGEFKEGGKSLTIKYSFLNIPFGKIIVASTTRGICYLMFVESERQSLDHLKTQYPNANFIEEKTDFHGEIDLFFSNPRSYKSNLHLHLKGTNFQLKVWNALLNIPEGKLCTYGYLANQIGNSKASRAVGSAVGYNPIAFIIPCHRVILSSGVSGNYRWGSTRKNAIIAWEAAKNNKRNG